MTEELDEIKERVEQLEGYVRVLESRVDLQESLMVLYSAGRVPMAPPDAGDPQSTEQTAENTPPSADDPRLKGFDYLLRTILTQQGMHNSDIRKTVRGQEGLRSSFEFSAKTLDSIQRMLLEIRSNVQTLVDQREAC